MSLTYQGESRGQKRCGRSGSGILISFKWCGGQGKGDGGKNEIASAIKFPSETKATHKAETP
jgi:hypothetical protein